MERGRSGSSVSGERKGLGGGLDTVAHGAGGGGLGHLELEEERRDLGAGARPESRVSRALGRPISKKENW
jgi:hypothetical protein